MFDNVEDFAPPPVTSTTSEWSCVSSTNPSKTSTQSDEEDEEEDIFGASFMPDTEDEDSGEEVMFEGPSGAGGEQGWSQGVSEIEE